MSYPEPTYQYRGSGEWEIPREPRVPASQTVKLALRLMADGGTLASDDETRRQDAQELLDRNDWTVYFP